MFSFVLATILTATIPQPPVKGLLQFKVEFLEWETAANQPIPDLSVLANYDYVPPKARTIGRLTVLGDAGKEAMAETEIGALSLGFQGRTSWNARNGNLIELTHSRSMKREEIAASANRTHSVAPVIMDRRLFMYSGSYQEPTSLGAAPGKTVRQAIYLTITRHDPRQGGAPGREEYVPPPAISPRK